MVTECPVCHTEYANRYIQAHITRESKRDEAHRKYRASHSLNDVHQEPVVIDPLDRLEFELQKNWGKIQIVTGDRGIGMSQVEPVYKETTSQIVGNASKPPDKTRRLAHPEPSKKNLTRKLKAPATKPQVVKGGSHWFSRRRRMPKKERAKAWRDPEDTLGILTMLPAVAVVLFLLYKMTEAIFTWNFGFFIDWTNSDIAQIYFWVLANPSQSISIIILVTTGLLVALAIFLIHQVIWRMLFKDIQVRYLKKDETTGELRAVGTSKIGRMYLIIGRGFWDRIYRRFTKKPVPETVTVYFKRRGFVNPFKVLASCDKGYLKDPDHSLFVTDGLFKRTLIATHLRRDTENHSTIYWFEGGDYKAIEFDSRWYEDTHTSEIKIGLSMVGKACGMDSSIQKEQMKNNISFLPTDLIAEQKRIWELKKAKMDKVKPELSR